MRNYKISRGAGGALGEMAATTDLLRRGYEVYRSVAPHSSCDLIAVRGREMIRVEVTCGIRSHSGGMYYNAHKKLTCIFDVIAVVDPITLEVNYVNSNGNPVVLD